MNQAHTQSNYIDYAHHKKVAVHFGSGNIGRGFIGKILSESGYYVIFIDIQSDIIEALHREHCYTVEIAHPPAANSTGAQESSYISYEEVRNVDGILSTASNATLINEAILHAHIITTAVGPTILPIIAKTLAPALAYRFLHSEVPINIIACENKIRASEILEQEVLAQLASSATSNVDSLTKKLAFPCCSVDRIVVATNDGADDAVLSNATGNGTAALLRVRVEEYFEWNIDSSIFLALPNGVAPHVAITQAKFTPTLDAYVERKLFTLNTGHTTLAYLGYLHKYRTIDEAMADHKLATVVLAAMKESAHALIAKWKFDEAEQNNYIETLAIRFRNALLHDEVTRVARDPLRKIDAQDRFVSPIGNCLQYNLPYKHLAFGLATALHFNFVEDLSAMALQEKISSLGVEAVLIEVCKITDGTVITCVQQYYKELANDATYLPPLE